MTKKRHLSLQEDFFFILEHAWKETIHLDTSSTPKDCRRFLEDDTRTECSCCGHGYTTGPAWHCGYTYLEATCIHVYRKHVNSLHRLTCESDFFMGAFLMGKVCMKEASGIVW